MAITTDSMVTIIGSHGVDQFHGGRIGFDEGRFVMDMWTTPPPVPRGSWHACPPVSPLSYRKRSKTRAHAMREGLTLVIFDDYGSPTSITTDSSTIDALERECREQGLCD